MEVLVEGPGILRTLNMLLMDDTELVSPATNGLVERKGSLQHSDERMAARSERQRVEGAGEDEEATQQQ